MFKYKTKNGKCDYCHIVINKEGCQGCEYFAKEWAYKLKQCENAHCHMHETKSMQDCKGAHFDAKKGRYTCSLEGHYGDTDLYQKCKYRTK